MSLDEQIQEVNTDIEEIKRLIDQTTRSRIKQNLELQKQKFEKELNQLQDKLQKQQQAAAAKAEQEKAASANPTPTTSHAYTKDITVYAWDQSDKFVKVYVDNLNSVGDLPSNQIQCTFENRAFHLQIQNLKNINYSLKKVRLLNDIDPAQSTYKVKKDMVIISLKKVESKNWECFLQDEKKTPVKPIPKLDNGKDSNEKFMNFVEEMYENGDDDTKRAIAKAWVQSREKANTMASQQEELEKTMPAPVLRTNDFTIYPAPKKS